MRAPVALGMGERAAEAAASLLALALYVVVVSRGELLPYAGTPRMLTAPALALGLAALSGWRLRRVLFSAEAVAFARRWALPAGVGLLAVAVRVAGGALAGSARAEEAAVLALALRIIGNEAPTDGEMTTLLAWLQAPVAAARYVAGVSDGRWQKIEAMTPADVLTWGRALHGLLSLLTVGLVGWIGARMGGRRAGLLAAGLLAVSGTSVTAGTTVDPRAPVALLATLVLAALVAGASRLRAHLAGRPRPVVLAGLVAAGLAGLWLPGLLGAVLAPIAALVAGLAGSALWVSRGVGRAGGLWSFRNQAGTPRR